ncbi:MAG: glycosyltransferase family 2 protein [bacterium]
MATPKVSIVILNWNNYKDTKECLESLEKITYPNFELVVVDNGSSDNSTKNIQKEFLRHIFIYNNDNLGYAGGINAGIRRAFDNGADYIFTMNNDMLADKSFLEPLIEVMEKDEKIGLAGPATYCYPAKEKLYTAGEMIKYWKGGVRQIGLPKDVVEVDCLGGCFLIKREVIEKIGYFYEPYFLDFEETEYCLRAARAGFKIVSHPKSKIWHKVSLTLNKIPASSAYYYYRNKLLFVKRNAPFYIKYPFYFYGSLYLVLKIAENLAKGDKTMAFSIKNSLTDFWQGNFCKGNPIKKYE